MVELSDKLAEHLCEYLYKKDTKRRDVDVFEDFLEIIKLNFPVIKSFTDTNIVKNKKIIDNLFI